MYHVEAFLTLAMLPPEKEPKRQGDQRGLDTRA